MKGLALLLGGALLAIPMAAAAAPPAPVPLTAELYRAVLAPVTDCAAFTRAWPELPDARPLLRGLFAGGILAKGPDETDDAFLNRAVKRLFDGLGDPSRLFLSIAVPAGTHYDAARQAMVLTLPQPLPASLDRYNRAENRIGEARLRTETELRAEIDLGAPGEIRLPMTPAAAARFATDARLAILALFEDYGTEASHQAAASGAIAVQTSYQLVRLKAKCALVTRGGAVVPGWSLNQWTDPAAP